MPGPVIIALLRHAEPESAGNDPALTAAGKKRAQLLASMFRDAGVTAIFISELRRTRETARPLAELLHLTPAVLPGLDSAAHRDRVRAVAGGVAVVVGNTNTVPSLVAALGVTAPVSIAADEFDRLFIVTPGAVGSAALLPLRYGGV